MSPRVKGIFIALALAVLPASADALVLGSIADTHVEAKDDDDNFGNFSTNRVGTAFAAMGADAFRLLLQFDATAIPAGVKIDSARLRLFIDDTTTDPLGLSITVRRLLMTFVEGDGMSGVTWDTQPPFAPLPAAVEVMNQSAGEWFEIDVTLVVRAALASGDTPGVIPLNVAATNEGVNEDREFEVRSKEFGGGAQRPQLVLVFEVDDVPLFSASTLMVLVMVLALVGLFSVSVVRVR